MPIASRADLAHYLEQDLAAHGLERWRARYRLTRRIAYFQWLLRRSEYWANCRRDPFGKSVAAVLAVRVKLLGERLGYSIPRNTFGPGLSIAHIGSIVVNSSARVGADCRIHQGVTLGAGTDGEAPTIGDGAHLSPNCSIIGGITIGNGVGVWANAAVTRDVPDRVSVAGVPARIVKRLDVPS